MANWFKIAAAVAAGGYAIYKGLKVSGIWDNYMFPTDVSMAVLGMQQSGKTSWYNYLKDGNPGNPSETGVQNQINSFSVDVPGGHRLIINEGTDIAGTENNVPVWYAEMVKNNQLILFLFDAQKFMLNKNNYKEDVLDRIALIAENDSVGKSVFIVPTHKDTLLTSNISENEMKENLFNILRTDEFAQKYANAKNITSAFQTNIVEDLTHLKDIIFSPYKNS